MKVKRAFKVRIYPIKEQAQVLSTTFSCCKFPWNSMLAEQNETYEILKDKRRNSFS